MEWPDREGQDIGIDLVAEEKDGSLCAIQCKCYADDGSLDERHVTNFLAYADGLKNFKNKILVYTGDNLTKHANTLLTKHRCSIIRQEHLRSSSIDWSEFPKLHVKNPFTLFDYQEYALDDVRYLLPNYRILKDKLDFENKSYVIQKENNTFSKIIFDIAQFRLTSGNDSSQRFAILPID